MLEFSFLRRTFRALRHRDFRLMWLGACASTIGTFVQQFAQSWLVYDLTKDAFYLGLDLFLGQLPIILFSLVGGVFADRMDRRKMLLGSQYIQMTCAFALAVLFLTHTVRIWEILSLSFVVGVGQSFGGPAYSALLPTLVPSEDLTNAIAMNSIQFNLARVLGPALGGLTYATVGATLCFTLNGLSYLAVIASLMMIQVKFVPQKTKESILKSMRAGLGFIRQREGLSAFVFLAFFTTLLGFSLTGFLPVIVQTVFHGGPQTYQLLLVSSGAGSIAGALAVAASERSVNTSRLQLGISGLRGHWRFRVQREPSLPKAELILSLFLGSGHYIVLMAEVPLYGKVEDVLASEIARGVLQPGDRLPSEDQLLTRFAVSRITVRRAIQNLIQRGMVEIRRGHGTYVLAPKISQELTRLTGFVEDMAVHGRKASARVVSKDVVAADSTVARQLRISKGTYVMRIERVRLADSIPMSFDETYLPLHVGKRIVRNDLRIKPIFTLLEEEYGIPLAEAEYVLEAAAASTHVAEALAVPEGSPIFRIERTSFTEMGQPIDYEILYYRGDLIRFTTRLARRPGSKASHRNTRSLRKR